MITNFQVRYEVKDGRRDGLQPHVMKLFEEGGWGAAQDKGGLLVHWRSLMIFLLGFQ